MDDLLLHTSTRASLESFLKNSGHALCLVGPTGAGKGYIAKTVARTCLGDATTDHIRTLIPDPSIGIEQIRELQTFLRLKQPGKAVIRRVIIIEDAQQMTDEAQNALLKMLEEPPEDTVFILTTDGSSSLKSTVYSRVQQVRVLPITQSVASDYFNHPEGKISTAFSLSGGYVGLLHGLLEDPEHELVTAVAEAKSLMRATPYERLLEVDRLAKQKERLGTLLYALERVVSAALQSGKLPTMKRLTGAMRAIYEARLDLSRSANAKLLLTDLFLHL